MAKLEDFKPVEEMPETLIQVPTFIRGSYLDAFEPAYENARKGNEYFGFRGRSEANELQGSKVFSVGLANKFVHPNFRVVVPTDDIYQTVFPMIDGKHYTDLNALDVWGDKPNYDKNTEFWKQAIELAEKQLGRSAEFPFRVQGFYVIPDEKEGGVYQARIEPAPNLRIIEDDKLNLSGRFSSLDENGMILPEDNGKYHKYTLGNGLSRVILSSDGGLDCDYLLDDADDGGRVVLTNAEGVSANFSTDDYITSVQKAYETKVRQAEQIREKAISDLEKL